MTGIRSRVDTVPLIGGMAVLDLVNTVSWRGDSQRSEDHLRGPDECLRWARRAGVLTNDEAAMMRRLLLARPELGKLLVDGLMEFRDVVAAAVGAQQGGALPPAAKAAILDAFEHGELIADDSGVHRWRITTVNEQTVRRRLALQLVQLLTSVTGRIGVCADRDCRWVFLDTSRARNRRWCSSADCGNRFRVRQHQRRHERASAG